MIRQLAVAAALLAAVASPRPLQPPSGCGSASPTTPRFASPTIGRPSSTASPPPARRSCARSSLARDRTGAAGHCDGPVRPGLQLRRTSTSSSGTPRRAVSRSRWRSGARPVGRTATRRRRWRPTDMNDFRAFAQAVATATRDASRGTRSSASSGSGTSRTWPRSCGRSSTPPAGSSAPRSTRGWQSRATPGSRPAIRRRLVAVGETSSNGRNRRVAGLTDTVAPGTFMQLMAKAAPRMRFDAWAQHPYPFPVNQAPLQISRWPNVTLNARCRLRGSSSTGASAQEHPDLDHRVRQRDEAG